MPFKKLLHTVWTNLRDPRDAWGNTMPIKAADHGVVIPAPPPSEEVRETREPRPKPPNALIQDMRQRLILGEGLEEEEAVSEEETQIVPAGDKVPTQTARHSFTEEQGMVTKTKDFLLRTVEGRFVKTADLHGGGRCHVCGGNTDKIIFCLICRKPICFTHAFPWEKNHLCPAHHRQMRFLQDTWAEDGKE